MRTATVLLLLGLLCMAAPALAQEHEHAAGKVTIRAPADGEVHAGAPALFTILDDGGDGVPEFHQDNAITISLNGKTLFATTSAAGHDYDGVAPVRIVFPVAGNYEVMVHDKNGAMVAHADGPVMERGAAGDGGFTLGASSPVAGGAPAKLQFSSAAPGIVVAEAYRDGELAFRTTARTDAVPREIRLTLDAGTYVIRATASGTHDGAPWGPVVRLADLVVDDLPPAIPGVPSLDPAENRVVEDPMGLPLVATFDPYDAVGPNGIQHVAIVGPATFTGTLAWTLTNELGQDMAGGVSPMEGGVFQVAYRTTRLGAYTLHVSAIDEQLGARSLAATWRVVPPLGQSALGPIAFDFGVGSAFVGSSLNPGEALGVVVRARDGQGNAYAHQDLDVLVLGNGDAPMLWSKLHAHGDGDFPIDLRVPGGDYTYVLSPSDLEADPVTFHGAEGLTAGLTFKLAVHPGPGFEAAEPTLVGTPTDGAKASPSAGMLCALAVLGLALAARRLQE